MFLNKYLGFSVNCLLQLLPSHHLLHFKVGIFYANAAEQPNQVSGMFQGIVGARAPSALLGSAQLWLLGKSSVQLQGQMEGEIL